MRTNANTEDVGFFSINANGLRQIREFLEANHTPMRQPLSQEMLEAWAADAEQSLMNCNGAEIELPARYSVTGCTLILRISREGYDQIDAEREALGL